MPDDTTEKKIKPQFNWKAQSYEFVLVLGDMKGSATSPSEIKKTKNQIVHARRLNFFIIKNSFY